MQIEINTQTGQEITVEQNLETYVEIWKFMSVFYNAKNAYRFSL